MTICIVVLMESFGVIPMICTIVLMESSRCQYRCAIILIGFTFASCVLVSLGSHVLGYRHHRYLFGRLVCHSCFVLWLVLILAFCRRDYSILVRVPGGASVKAHGSLE